MAKDNGNGGGNGGRVESWFGYRQGRQDTPGIIRRDGCLSMIIPVVVGLLTFDTIMVVAALRWLA